METLNLKDLKYLKLTANELNDIIRFIAKKRTITSKKILENININKKLTETQRKLTKTQQKLIKLQKLQIESRELIKPIKSQKSQQKITNLQK